ncbi:hypothetical protein FSP39_020233 [Pinctada imbricata]|uniref:Peptidase A2 domain-containing protein n=1 Tax=Pinctada imbricata TaxID=66713 RepID=A0AA88Y5K6_PINIB|nr:hypothetical protein FSP39_020233 [Pinctada imbricata]
MKIEGQSKEISRKWGNGIYIHGKVWETDIEFLVDSGSTVSIVSIQTFDKLTFKTQMSLSDVTVNISDASGNKIHAYGAAYLPITFGKSIYHQKFLVCDVAQSAILGQDFMLEHVRKLDFQKLSLLTHDFQEINCWTGAKEEMKCAVMVDQAVTIPSNSGLFISINIPEAGHLTDYGLIETKSLEYFPEIHIIPGVVDLNQRKLYINAINTGNEEFVFHKGQTIGTCYAYCDSSPNEEIILACQTTDKIRDLPEHLHDLLERSSKFLDDEQKGKLKQILTKYQTVFSKTPEDIGRTNLAQHKINTGTAFPIRQPARRLPFGKREIEKVEIAKMKERGIIEPSNSPWASNIVLVTKRDGKVRFCVDYRKLNDVTIKYAYPIPRVDDCLDSLAGSKWFSSMDLNSGFWQIGMAPDDKEKTAFIPALDYISSRLCLLAWQTRPPPSRD